MTITNSNNQTQTYTKEHIYTLAASTIVCLLGLVKKNLCKLRQTQRNSVSVAIRAGGNNTLFLSYFIKYMNKS